MSTDVTGTSFLRQLAERAGILAEYIDQTGQLREASDETRAAILEAMGLDAASEDAARRTLAELDDSERSRTLAPVRVVPHGAPLELALGSRDAELALEMGDVASLDAAARGALPIGYHTLRAGDDEQRLIVVPPHCVLPPYPMAGVIANLYAVRSERNWGVGDLSDLAALGEWSAERGASFVGVSPLHALRDRGHDISPYAPMSRLFRNAIYIDVEQVPELLESDDARAMLERAELREALARLRASARVDYERVWTLKARVLRALFRTFVAAHRDAETTRGVAFREVVDRQGRALGDFALFCALEEHFTRDGAHPPPWTEWPAQFRRPDSPDCEAFRLAHEDEIDFHRWLQFELDRQLADAAERGRRAGLGLGIYQDLAIGASPNSSDVWAFRDLFVDGVSLGAPPDLYAPQGQNWGLPPIDPRRLREDCYDYWIALLRASLAHAGALRIDHVLGLFRQFWIPSGMPGSAGAYVRFPTDDLFGILALESARHRAVIVGEDLGTVPPEVPGTLRRWRVLGSRVLHFEREPDGRYRAASSYEPLSLATADSHDMATIAGWWAGRDIELCRAAGLIESDERAHAARIDRERDRRLLLERLAADGALDEAREPASGAELRAAVHRFLCRTPALLVGFMLEDLVGEREPVNMPGVSLDAFPSWTRRLAISVEQLRGNRDVEIAFACRRDAPP